MQMPESSSALSYHEPSRARQHNTMNLNAFAYNALRQAQEAATHHRRQGDRSNEDSALSSSSPVPQTAWNMINSRNGNSVYIRPNTPIRNTMQKQGTSATCNQVNQSRIGPESKQSSIINKYA